MLVILAIGKALYFRISIYIFIGFYVRPSLLIIWTGQIWQYAGEQLWRSEMHLMSQICPEIWTKSWRASSSSRIIPAR
ncbi:hypothetical protein MTBSS4_450036 [Magnetospirillum sp. SS-4]|nr:hypothetical protein MTBSS4_450036 [Magnetospirillum sp. SS-4]